MRRNIIFMMLLFSLSINAQYGLYTDGDHILKECKSFKAYSYSFVVQNITGLTTRGKEIGYVTWSVVNGKIADENGNYTLTTLTKRADVPPMYTTPISKVSIMWDIAEKGKIIFKMPLDYYLNSTTGQDFFEYEINIIPFDGYVQNVELNSERIYKADDLYLENVNIKSGANITFNGYNSIQILPGFTAESGSNVRIFNGTPSSSVRTMQAEYSTGIDPESDDLKATLNQNSPNPSKDGTSISCYIPEQSGQCYIQIHNVFGNVMKKIVIPEKGLNQILIQTSDLFPGMYTYSLIIDHTLIDSKRMIIGS